MLTEHYFKQKFFHSLKTHGSNFEPRYQSLVCLGIPSTGVFQYESTQHHLEPGDRIVLYTDGIIEASNASGEFFGSERFKTFIEAHEQLQADEFVDAFLEQLSNWSKKRSGEAAGDDLTLLVIELEKTEED